jgi:hypothetical protein
MGNQVREFFGAGSDIFICAKKGMSVFSGVGLLDPDVSKNVNHGKLSQSRKAGA